MIQKLKNYLSGRWRRFALLAIWLVLSGAIVLTLPSNASPTPKNPATPTEPASINKEIPQATPGESRVADASTQKTQPAASPENPAPASNSTPAPKPKAKITVSLSIDDVFQGNVTLPVGSDNCDVLNQALKDGTISSLTMRYSEAHKSYGVYVINGVGDEANVWWAFKISGRSPPLPSPWSPPLGCSHIEAENGDAIEWEYVKN